MAKKMGRKARKFAKKNLQSVMKRKRKLNAVFKKKFAPRKGNNDSLEESKKLENDLQTPVDPEEEIPDGIASNSLLGDLLIKEDDDFDEDVSDSDGYLSEDPEWPCISEVEGESCSEEKCTDVVLLEQNKEINQRLNSRKRKLSKLCDKDLQFSKFLESRRSEILKSRSEAVYSDDEGDTCSIDDEDLIEDEISQVSKVITSSTVDTWCWLAMEQPNSSALANLLNAFRAACHYGLETGEVSPLNIANGEVFSKILTFVLSEAEGIFCRLLRFSGSLNKDCILKMTNKPEWKTMRPLIKSFLRSSLFLLNQETDSHILEFVLSQLRSSILLFSAFPSLTKKLMKISIYLWVTGDNADASSKLDVKLDRIQAPGKSSKDICKRNLLKGIIADESATVHDTATLGVVVDRHCGYTAVASVPVDAGSGESPLTEQDIHIEEQPEGGSNSLNVNSLRMLLHKSSSCGAQKSHCTDMEDLHSFRSLVLKVLADSMLRLDEETKERKMSIRWELGACWVQHLENQSENTDSNKSKDSKVETTVKGLGKHFGQLKQIKKKVQDNGETDSTNENSTSMGLIKEHVDSFKLKEDKEMMLQKLLPEADYIRLKESNTGLHVKSPDELIEMAFKYYEDIALPKLVADFASLELSPVDGRTLTDFMHTRGLQMCSLGHVVDLADKLPHVQSLCLHEMIVRAYKHILQAIIAVVGDMSNMAGTIASCLNVLLGSVCPVTRSHGRCAPLPKLRSLRSSSACSQS